ncbi:ABC transporter substrate-binding protein [Myxococcota bacterium]|nr:ABC transporter substrate-binding protein [Myxococcota bacterium]
MIWSRPLTLALLVGLAAPSIARADAPPSPKPWLKEVIDKGHALAKRKPEAGSQAEVEWRVAAKALIDDVLGWQELTEQALGTQWKKLKPAEQQDFAKLLREMIEASYQSKMKLIARGDVKKPEQITIEWLEEKIDGNDAAISARVKADKSVAVLTFKQKWNGARWWVYDVAIDEVSTVRTYRTQFNKIITKQGFPALVDLMKSKIEEIRAGRADLAP